MKTMTQEDKDLLLKDLCGRLPYGVIVKAIYNKPITREMGLGMLHDFMFDNISDVKPYLRPMSSMTEEEKIEYCDLQDMFLNSSQYPVTDAFEMFDWLNAHHFDYRGLIPIGLALEAPIDMYKTE